MLQFFSNVFDTIHFYFLQILCAQIEIKIHNSLVLKPISLIISQKIAL